MLTVFFFMLENYFVTSGRRPVHHFSDFIKRPSHLWSKYNVGRGLDGRDEHLLHSRIIHIYTYTRGNKINNNDEQTHFFRKIYLSHFIRNVCERVMCERWVGDWTNCNVLTPSSFVFSSISFSLCWAAQSGVLRAHSPLLGADSLYSILSPTNWLQLTEPVCGPGLYNCLTHTCFLCSR